MKTGWGRFVLASYPERLIWAGGGGGAEGYREGIGATVHKRDRK